MRGHREPTSFAFSELDLEVFLEGFVGAGGLPIFGKQYNASCVSRIFRMSAKL